MGVQICSLNGISIKNVFKIATFRVEVLEADFH